ncbi:MAG: hypothetical protein RQ767_01785 [Thermovirgaceae bacterium]|nr:hypothetical protein [Thermovirgaceae bacterium]
MEDKKRTAAIRPSPFASAAGAIVFALFLIFGIVFFSVVLSENSSEAGLQVLIAMFGLIWVTVCGLGIVFNIRNYRSWSQDPPNSSIATTIGVIEYDVNPDKDNLSCFDTKLRKLENLRKDDLITEEEYKEKRREIMNEKW